MQWVKQKSDWVACELPTQPEWVVIWLHGLGAQAAEFKSVVHIVQSRLHAVIQWHLCQAPNRSVSLNYGAIMPAWYDIFGLNADAPQDLEGIMLSAKQLLLVCQSYIDQGVKPDRIILVGFSQGGALALYAALIQQLGLKWVLGLSTYLPVSERLSSMVIASDLNVCLMHGRQDEVIMPEIAEMTQVRLSALLTSPPKLKWFDMGHSLCDPQLMDIVQWFEIVLSSASTAVLEE